MSDWYNLHPALSSFPLPLLTLLIIIEIFQVTTKSTSYEAANKLIAWAVLLAVLAAFFSGYQGADFANGAFKVADEVIAQHHLIGKLLLFSAVPTVLAALVRSKAKFGREAFSWIYRILLVISFSLAATAGYLGGNLVFEHGAGVRVGVETVK